MELITGEIYFYHYLGNNKWLFKETGEKQKGTSVNLDDKNLEKYSSFGYLHDCKELRLANKQEIAHFNACIAANKYVECPKEENILSLIEIW